MCYAIVYFRCFQILGFGYADLENEVPIRPNSALRIASISKSVTAVMVAKLWEDGRIDLDQRVQHYLPDFPQKYYMNEKVTFFFHVSIFTFDIINMICM